MAAYNIMVRATALSGVRGRIDYISNPKRQEHLQAVHATADQDYWTALAAHCQEQAKHSQSKKACEGREYMVSLANDLAGMDPAELATRLSDRFKKLTGTENVVAIHWNKTRTNYHAHVVVAENPEINQVTYGAELTRNTYYDANGRRSTKKACVDQDGQLLPGCRFYKKGDRIEHVARFGAKIDRLSGKSFLQEVKQAMAAMQNELLEQGRYQVFDRSGIYLAEQHIGKNTTPDQQASIRAKNALVREFNSQANAMLALAAKAGSEALQDAQEDLRTWRKDIKVHGLTDRWIRYISLQIKKIQKRIQALKEILIGKEQQAAGLEPGTKQNSMATKLAAAAKKAKEMQRQGVQKTSLDAKVAVATKKTATKKEQPDRHLAPEGR